MNVWRSDEHRSPQKVAAIVKEATERNIIEAEEKLIERGEDPRANDKVHVYKDRGGEWRWRRRAANGLNIAVSGEGYVNHSHALRMAQTLNPGIPLLDQADGPTA